MPKSQVTVKIEIDLESLAGSLGVDEVITPQDLVDDISATYNMHTHTQVTLLTPDSVEIVKEAIQDQLDVMKEVQFEGERAGLDEDDKVELAGHIERWGAVLEYFEEKKEE